MISSAMLLLVMLPAVMGHSYLAKPASRNLLAHIAGKEDCPHCLQSGGPDNVFERGGGIWPTRLAPASHGLCGDPVQGSPIPMRLEDETYLKAGQVTATYQPGEIAEFHIAVSTHHKGHYEFRICDRALDAATLSDAAEGQACLDGHLLERAAPAEDCVVNDARGDCQPLDPKHPERWYLPPAGSHTQQAGPDFDDSMAPEYPSGSEIHIMRYKIPEDLSCSSCTLQWFWSSGNSCYYDGDYFDYFQMLDRLGWTVADWDNLVLEPWANCDNRCCKTNGTFGEEFWNCADIAVLGDVVVSTTATSTMPTTSTAVNAAWEPVDGGDDRACRGANSGDNSGNYYNLLTRDTLDDCKGSCAVTDGCVGIEYMFRSGRCEVWTRPDGIRASIAVNGITCLRYGTLPSTTTQNLGPFEPVDGGEGRVCRGANSGDNLASYFSVFSGTSSLDACKVLCANTQGCVGIEYNTGARCEVWTRPDGIRATVAASSSFSCWRYGTLPTTTMPAIGSFQAVDGGDGRACRGGNADDNLASYYSANSASSLEECQLKCAAAAGCVGIEFNLGGRCEVWTRPEGIQASKAVWGFSCFRYSEPVSTTATTTATTTTTGGGCAAAWEKCGGDSWTGPTCCSSGYQCERESEWYSQCRPVADLLQPKGRSRRQHFLGTAFLQNSSTLHRSTEL